MENVDVKTEARKLIDALPPDATWEDLMYKIYVRQSIEAGIEDSNAGRTISITELRAKFDIA
jgi:hypothetical protein